MEFILHFLVFQIVESVKDECFSFKPGPSLSPAWFSAPSYLNVC